MATKSIMQYTVYVGHPRYRWVVRRVFDHADGPAEEKGFWGYANTTAELESIRRELTGRGYTRLPRDPVDEPMVLETWH